MKSPITLFFIGLILVIGFFSPLFPGEMIHTVAFEPTQLSFSTLKNYDQISLLGCELSFQPGVPQLPVRAVQLELPDGSRVEKVEIITTESKFLSGKFQLWPVQNPQPLSMKAEPQFTAPDPQFYHSNTPYPVQLIEFTGQGTLGRATLVNLLIYPVQYFPDSEQLKFHSSVTFRVVFQSGIPKFSGTGQSQLQKMKNRLTGKSVEDFSPTELEPGTFPYLIITKEEFIPDFQPLADWKTQKGVRSKIVSTQWLIRNYRQFPSNSERIRAFLQDAVKDWGTVWVLLGGDTNIIQSRKCWALDCQMGMDPTENNIPCDLYYADLDGNWDANNNRIYGEVDDEVDLYPDLFVGRAPCENSDEIKAFVAKLLTYEKSPNPDYILRMLFTAELLWKDPYTDQGAFLDRLLEEIIPGRFSATRLYQSLGNENHTSVMNAMNRGAGIFNHDGHCWYNIMSVGEGSLIIPDMVALHNKNMYGILFSIGCWPAAYDFDCIAEHYVTNPKGGGIAFVGNSRYGWGSPGNPGLGYSDRFNETFFEYLFSENIYHLGELVAQTKARYVPYARQANVYRWCMYQLNLLGDPEMPIWTNTPRNLTAIYPQEIPGDSGLVTITVLSDQQSRANATVCLTNFIDVYQVGKTDLNGQVNFTVSTAHPDVNLFLTATAQNFLPLEKKIRVSTTKAYVAAAKMKIDDTSSSFVDSLANPGESIKLDFEIKNYGSAVAQNLSAALVSDDSRVAVSENLLAIGDLAGKASKIFPAAFSATFDSSLQNGDAINLQFVITSAETSWTHTLGIPICAPVLQAAHISLADSLSGNNNGFAEAGEIVQAKLWIKNSGSTCTVNLKIEAECSDSCLKLIDQPHDWLVIEPDSCVQNYCFDLEIAENLPGNPAPIFPEIIIHTFPQNGCSRTDTLTLSIGKTGLTANMEDGSPDWTQSGKGKWQLDTQRTHSGDKSWYCGDPATRTYAVELDQSLESPPFYLAPNSQLSFWLWYDVALYSAWGYEGDGLHVEIKNGNQWEQLDFIGTGGALNPVLLGNDWMPYFYDLSEFENGQEMQVRFRFISDTADEPFEGVYLDDVQVGAPSYGVPQIIYDPVTEINENPVQPLNFKLSQNYPNPFNPVTTIAYQLPKKCSVKLKIFNMLGQHVRELISTNQPAGNYLVKWDGRNDRGEIAGTGLYFYQITAGDVKLTRKMLLMK